MALCFFGWGLGYDSRRKEQDESALEHANELFKARQDGIKLGEMRMLDRLVCLKLLTEEQAKEVMHGCQIVKNWKNSRRNRLTEIRIRRRATTMSDPISDVLDMRTCDDDAVCVMVMNGKTLQISNNGTGTQLLNMHASAVMAILEQACKDFENEAGQRPTRELMREFMNETIDEVMKRWK